MHGGRSLLEQGSLRLEQVDEDPEMSIVGWGGTGPMVEVTRGLFWFKLLFVYVRRRIFPEYFSFFSRPVHFYFFPSISKYIKPNVVSKRSYT